MSALVAPWPRRLGNKFGKQSVRCKTHIGRLENMGNVGIRTGQTLGTNQGVCGPGAPGAFGVKN
jgi:hypothetical protein